jgi:hypothetical protein
MLCGPSQRATGPEQSQPAGQALLVAGGGVGVSDEEGGREGTRDEGGWEEIVEVEDVDGGPPVTDVMNVVILTVTDVGDPDAVEVELSPPAEIKAAIAFAILVAEAGLNSPMVCQSKKEVNPDVQGAAASAVDELDELELDELDEPDDEDD